MWRAGAVQCKYVCWGTDHSSPGSDQAPQLRLPLSDIATQLGSCTANWYEQSQAPDNYFARIAPADNRLRCIDSSNYFREPHAKPQICNQSAVFDQATAREMQDRIGLQLTVSDVCSKHEAHPMRPLSFGLSQTVTMEITTLDNHTVPGERSTCCHRLSWLATTREMRDCTACM